MTRVLETMGRTRASSVAEAGRLGQVSGDLNRRSVLISALACAACGMGRDANGSAASVLAKPLRQAAPFPVGCALSSASLDDPGYVAAFLRHFSQITPEWEMKMGPMLARDGQLVAPGGDRIAAFARQHQLRVHGTTLVWYKNPPALFQSLAGNPALLRDRLGRFILAAMGRYAGVCRGWDVVNEPLEEDGSLRSSLWASVLGAEDHIAFSFEQARAADPNAVLFLNEYGLEARPAKLNGFLRLVERLLKRGVPIGGLGTQSHINIDVAPRELRETIDQLRQFGLPIHVSELDISTARGRLDLRSDAAKLKLQADVAEAMATAFVALPAAQRYAFTLWGMRDSDSWLSKPPMLGARGGSEMPLAFDGNGGPKPMAAALLKSFEVLAKR